MHDGIPRPYKAINNDVVSTSWRHGMAHVRVLFSDTLSTGHAFTQAHINSPANRCSGLVQHCRDGHPRRQQQWRLQTCLHPSLCSWPSTGFRFSLRHLPTFPSDRSLDTSCTEIAGSNNEQDDRYIQNQELDGGVSNYKPIRLVAWFTLLSFCGCMATLLSTAIWS